MASRKTYLVSPLTAPSPIAPCRRGLREAADRGKSEKRGFATAEGYHKTLPFCPPSWSQAESAYWPTAVR
jgi:hypothetical protein